MKLLISFLLSFSCFTVFAQIHTSHEIVDTIKIKGKEVILFSNHNWQYLSEYKAKLEKLNTEIITSYWDTENIHAYRTYIGEKKPFDFSQLDSSNFSMPPFRKFFRGFGGNHTGTDLGLNIGDSVVAMFDGKVRYAKYHSGGYGYLVIIRHANGLETWYAHLTRLLVETNQEVSSGQLIGLGGMTGRASGAHLHLETRYLDRPMDPATFIDFTNKRLKDKSNHTVTKISSNTNQTTTIAKDISKKSVHVISQGDTLYSLAKRYKTTVDAICKANKISSKQTLRLGNTLLIP